MLPTGIWFSVGAGPETGFTAGPETCSVAGPEAVFIDGPETGSIDGPEVCRFLTSFSGLSSSFL